MRTVAPAMAIALLLLAVVLSAADVSGTWNLEMKWVGPTETITSTGECNLERKGDQLSGTCGGGSDKFPVTGQADGNHLSWRVDIQQGGQTARMEFTGDLDDAGTTVLGSCRIVGVQDGTFAMKKRQ